MNLCVSDAVLITLGKLRELYTKEMLNMLNGCNGVQHMFNIARLTPSLISDSIVDEVHDPRTSRINLVQMQLLVIRIGIFFFLKKQLKLKKRNRF